MGRKRCVRRRGDSPVIETVILFAVLSILVMIASQVAGDAVNAQVENAQFDQAKNVMLALDKMAKKIAYKPESSGYVKTDFWTVLPQFTSSNDNMTLSIEGVANQSIRPNVFRIKGGERTSVSTDADLVGSGEFIITNVSSSMGRVRVFQSAGAWITLDYSRVSCINLGTVNYYNGTDYETYNLVEITVIEFAFGSIDFQQHAALIVRNNGMTPTLLEDIPKGSNRRITVRVNGVEQESIQLADLGCDLAYKTKVNLVKIKLEMSVSPEA